VCSLLKSSSCYYLAPQPGQGGGVQCIGCIVSRPQADLFLVDELTVLLTAQ
jgi:hypothetical protein